MRYLITVLLAISLGCIQEPKYDNGFFRPDYTPNVQPTPAPVSKPNIVLVTEPWCAACKDQKKILDSMRQDGLVGTVRATHSKDPSYPALKLPTIYVCTDNGCTKLEGLQTEDQILKAAR